jgi:glycosyltransferase involved in cell wall biosynthesis
LARINLIYLHPHFTLPGGSGHVVLEGAIRLDPEKYNVHIICIKAAPQYKRRYPTLSFIETGGPLSDSLFFWLSFPLVQYKVHRELNRLRPNIIVPQVLPSNWWGFIYKLFHKDVPCLWYCHEPSAFIHFPEWIESIKNPLLRAGAKLLNPLLKAIDVFLVSKGTDCTIGNSLFSTTLYKKAYHKHTKDYVYPGVDLGYFRPQDTKQNYFFMVSRLTSFKEVHVAIEAMSKLRHREYQLLIGGEGEEKNRLISLSNKLNLSERVSFLGKVPFDDLPNLYGRAKLVLFTSRNEPFGMVPVEALAAGTPVIGHNSGGLRETIRNNYNGILLDDMTSDNLAKAIDDSLDNPDRYNWLQKNSRESAAKFVWEEHVRQFEKALQHAL